MHVQKITPKLLVFKFCKLLYVIWNLNKHELVMIEMNGKLEMAIVKNMAANLGQIAVCLLHCLTFVLNSI